MGILVSPEDEHITLGRRCLIGRGETAELRIDDSRVSGEHALLKWCEGQWVLRELGSLNGSYLNGQRLPPGARAPLSRGARLGFADCSRLWVLADDGEPLARARRLVDSLCVEAQGGLLSLPCVGGGGVSLYIGPSRQWELDTGIAATRSVHDQQVILVGEHEWLLELPPAASVPTPTAAAQSPAMQFSLRFRVDRTQEHVEVYAVLPDGMRKLPDRIHNQMLLLLAREQMEDQQSRGFSEAESGWIHIEELAQKLSSDRATVTVHIWRARQTFAGLGLGHPESVVERRKYSGRVRLGVRVHEVVQL